MDKLLTRAFDGDPRSIGRLISLVEAESPESKEIMKKIYPRTGKAHVIGITGSPGAGKSTFVNRLISQFKAEGKKVGVIAIDPSSPFTGGAILGDRLRMQDHAVEEGVFIRSMGSRGNLGGVSRGTHEAALILDACGFDAVIIETVGVGQSEVDIVKIADTVCLILTPGMGDDVQIMKAGIMEIADVFVVNKADKSGSWWSVHEVKFSDSPNVKPLSIRPLNAKFVGSNSPDMSAAFDGDRNSRWASGTAIRSGMTAIFEFSGPKKISKITADLNTSKGDFPDQYEVLAGNTADSAKSVEFTESRSGDTVTFAENTYTVAYADQ